MSNFLTKARKQAGQSIKNALGSVASDEKSLLLSGAIASRQVRAMREIRTLADVEFRVYSQWGEDGILDWIIEQCDGIPQSFIEFGVESYAEANTRFLLQNRNWRGMVIDGRDELPAVVAAQDISWRHDITPVSAFITAENINQLFAGAGFSGEIGVLSVDIDGTDYWVWKAINTVDPWIIVAEYNSAFGDLVPLTIPYRTDYVRAQSGMGKLFYGASIAAFDGLANERGYVRLGANSNGSNVFYARNDIAGILLPKIGSTAVLPSRFRETTAQPGAIERLSGARRYDVLAEQVVVDLRNGQEVALGQLKGLFSDAWLAHLSGASSAPRKL